MCFLLSILKIAATFPSAVFLQLAMRSLIRKAAIIPATGTVSHESGRAMNLCLAPQLGPGRLGSLEMVVSHGSHGP